MGAGELFQQGKLKEAVEAAIDDVRHHPVDVNRRGLLAELLCFQGEWERADKQLETLGQQDPKCAVGVSLFRQLIRAEMARRDFATEGRLPEFLDGIPPILQLPLKASVALREGHQQEAAGYLNDAEQERPRRPGVCNDRPFEDIRDLDDLFSSSFEVLTSTGKYYWIPTQQIQLIEFHPAERPRDLLWRRARMVVKSGPDGDVYLPTTYIGSRSEADESFRLGRQTDWRTEEGGPTRGVGQRIFLVGDDEVSILEMKLLSWES